MARLGKPPHENRQHPAEKDGHRRRPTQKKPLLVAVIPPALTREQVESLARLVFVSENHAVFLSLPPPRLKPDACRNPEFR
jgi:hypothetical protein